MTRRIPLLVLLLLGACASDDFRQAPPVARDGAVKIGKPYQIGGIWYSPQDDLDYDEVGYASWYGKQFHGRPTASGERFDMYQLSAAHRTLPLPSYVRVTNLSNGRSMIVRVNDRGPFVKGRIIDMSFRGAQLLGFSENGVQKVRVQRVSADGRAIQRAGPQSLVAAASPPPVPIIADIDPPADIKVTALDDALAPPPASAGVYVQIAALSNLDRALELLGRIEPRDEASVDEALVEGRRLYRVRLGPYTSRGLAEDRLARAKTTGFTDARIFTALD